MADFFSKGEVVHIGVEIEVNGRDFYNEVLKKAKTEKVKDMFSFLAKEEEKHIEVFKKILSEVESFKPKEAFNEEYFSYIRALSKEHVFTQKNKGKEIAKKIKTSKQAIDLAIGFEKDSILFYVEMKNFVPENDHRIIDRLIEEERKHLKLLSEIKETL